MWIGPLVCLSQELKVKNGTVLTTLGFHSLKKEFPFRHLGSICDTDANDIFSVANRLSFKGRHNSFRAGTQKDTKLLESIQVFFNPLIRHVFWLDCTRTVSKEIVREFIFMCCLESFHKNHIKP